MHFSERVHSMLLQNEFAFHYAASCPASHPMAIKYGEFCCSSAFRGPGCTHMTSEVKGDPLRYTDPEECCEDALQCCTGGIQCTESHETCEGRQGMVVTITAKRAS